MGELFPQFVGNVKLEMYSLNRGAGAIMRHVLAMTTVNDKQDYLLSSSHLTLKPGERLTLKGRKHKNKRGGNSR